MADGRRGRRASGALRGDDAAERMTAVGRADHAARATRDDLAVTEPGEGVARGLPAQIPRVQMSVRPTRARPVSFGRARGRRRALGPRGRSDAGSVRNRRLRRSARPASQRVRSRTGSGLGAGERAGGSIGSAGSTGAGGAGVGGEHRRGRRAPARPRIRRAGMPLAVPAPAGEARAGCGGRPSAGRLPGWDAPLRKRVPQSMLPLRAVTAPSPVPERGRR